LELNLFSAGVLGSTTAAVSMQNRYALMVVFRYTDRTQSRTIAGLYMRQQEGAAIGASNFGVARYLKNMGTQNNLGAMVTHRLDESNSAKGLSAAQ
jgi:hypothetical protein